MALDLSMFPSASTPAATTPPPKTSGLDLSMFDTKNTPKPTPTPESTLGDNPWSDLKSVGQAGAALVTGAAAPLSAAVQMAGEKLTGQPVSSYSAAKQNNTYQPTDPNAQGIVQGVGTVLKPVGDALHTTAKVLLNDLYGDNDPEHINMASDALAYAVPGLKPTVKVGAAGAEEIASQAPSIANHPAVIAANDLAGKYNVQLTKGQQVAQAASDLPASQTATAKALNLPYQTEARLADQATTPVGKALDNHFDTQQNVLAGHVQNVADSLRKVGEDDAADAVEGTISQTSPGVNVVSGTRLQRVVNKDLIQDPALSAKLDDLNNLHDIIEQPDTGPITASPGGLISKLTGGKPIPTAIGSTVGGVAGFKLGGLLGHPFVGADAGAALGAMVGNKVSGLLNGLRSGSVDLGTLTDADLAPAAKELGLSTADLRTELAKPQNAQAVAKTAAPTPAPQPGVSPSPQPVPAGTMGTVDLPPAAQALAPKPAVTAGPPGAADFAKVTGPVKSDPGYVYHVTNADNAQSIASEGIKTAKPWEGTDQETWPDGSTASRNYFTPKSENTWQFAPEEGKPVLLRIPQDVHTFKAESGTGDLYSNKTVSPSQIEYLGADQTWKPLNGQAPTPGPAPAPVISTPTQAAQAASQALYNHLQNNKLQVVFNKVGDGTERTMNATLKDEHLPEGYTSDTAKYPQLVPGKPLTVWDLDKQGWRSFHPNTVKSIKVVQ
jgi:WYL_2, Sm-like SH3 beta-barrel fold